MVKPTSQVRNPSAPTGPEAPSGPGGTIAHMEEEFKELEELNRPRKVLALAAILLIGGIVGGYFWFVRDRSTVLAPPVPIEGVLIETSQPHVGAVLDPSAPVFAWESVASRDTYVFTIKLEGAPAPTIERNSKSSTVRLTEADLKLLAPGSYIWYVKARDKDGTILGTGHGRFRLR